MKADGLMHRAYRRHQFQCPRQTGCKQRSTWCRNAAFSQNRRPEVANRLSRTSHLVDSSVDIGHDS